jgi:hypothetical protein
MFSFDFSLGYRHLQDLRETWVVGVVAVSLVAVLI